MESKKIIDFDKVKMLLPPVMDNFDTGINSFEADDEGFSVDTIISPREYMKKVAEETRLYQFDTNFYLSPGVVDYIEFTPGVECLTIDTPYSGTVEIGKMFNEDEVKNGIRKNIDAFFFPKNPRPTKSQLLTRVELTRNQQLPLPDGVNPE